MNNTRTILVIDDSELIRKLIPVRLKDLNAQFMSAGSGECGLKMIAENDPDLVLLDVNMPGMSGFDVCEQLKSDPSTHDIPIIFLTGSEDTVDKVRGFELGAVDYVTKPFEPAELRARVRTALRTKELIDMLAEQAQIDGLTALHNRRYFDERLAQELGASKRYERNVGLLLMDIDHFKSINDNHGHPMGDEVLRQMARILRAFVRSSDAACRYGGEEFAIIFPESTHEHVFQAGVRLLEAIRTDAQLTAVLGRMITVSIGTVCACPDDNLVPAAVVKLADESLYNAKSSGRNRVCSNLGWTSAESAA